MRFGEKLSAYKNAKASFDENGRWLGVWRCNLCNKFFGTMSWRNNNIVKTPGYTAHCPHCKGNMDE